MSQGTSSGGGLVNITNCYLVIPNYGTIYVNNLPDISDSKSSAYNDEPIMGRSFPLKTFSHSENRSISVNFHFFVNYSTDIMDNLNDLRAIQSCLYPLDGSGNVPFYPPPVCQLICGKLLGDTPLCVVLKNYSVKFATDVVWDDTTLLPYKFDLDTSWDVVYRTSCLPGQQRIVSSGN